MATEHIIRMADDYNVELVTTMCRRLFHRRGISASRRFIFLLPLRPAAVTKVVLVFLATSVLPVEFWICLVLTFLGYIPGIIYAIYAITKK